MRAIITRGELNSLLKEWDRIHPKFYEDADLNDQTKIDITPCPPQDDVSTAGDDKAPDPIIIRKQSDLWQSAVIHDDQRLAFKTKIREGQQEIHRRVMENNAAIVHRMQAHNRKSAHGTIVSERTERADIVEAQLKTWRSLLPKLLRQFSRIPDPRRTKSVQHKLTVLMMFGLFAFVLRLKSCREMNRELTSATINTYLREIFPELDSTPHADTLKRVLSTMNPRQIEAAHIELIRDLIKKKKFRKLLIHDCLPVSVDGAQKLYRNGLLQDSRWCERKVGGDEDNPKIQQYLYAIEANITFQNGLNIPLMTEYLYRDNNLLNNPTGKQDSETTAFERLAERLKKYFPRLKILLCADAMYATQGVLEIIHNNHWEHLITLPKRKLTDLAKRLNQQSETRQSIPNQSYYRRRHQEFFWDNNIDYGHENGLTIHTVACLESFEKVDQETAEIKTHYSEHAWISSISLNINNVHELCNLGARKKELIEDSINTEKNRGYNYKHAFCYNWNAMQGFHYLMRLGHAINALSEFTKKLKKYIRDLGVDATLKLIKETLFSPWLSVEWYADQRTKPALLELQLE